MIILIFAGELKSIWQTIILRKDTKRFSDAISHLGEVRRPAGPCLLSLPWTNSFPFSATAPNMTTAMKCILSRWKRFSECFQGTPLLKGYVSKPSQKRMKAVPLFRRRTSLLHSTITGTLTLIPPSGWGPPSRTSG